MIALIDYGAGNLTSVRKALSAVGAAFFTPASPADLQSAEGIIIPGVGHFGATRALDESWRSALLSAVDSQVPLLGICLGLQYLFEGSDEAPDAPGLGALEGRCSLLPPTLKVPHVGWNALEVRRPSRILDGVTDATQVYFTHSYAAPVTTACVAAATHSASFAAVVEAGVVSGVQFHPEKSSEAGLRMLRNFLQITRVSSQQASEIS